MDRSKFTANAPVNWFRLPGLTAHQRRTGRSSRSNCPWTGHSIPTSGRSWRKTHDRLGTLNGIGQTLDDPDLLLQPLQSREAIKSSEIEGTTVTPEQYLLFELDPHDPQSANEESANWLEVLNYNVASRQVARWSQSAHQQPHYSFNARRVDDRRAGTRQGAGQFRRKQVQIGSNARYIAPPCAEVDRLMQNLDTYIGSDEH